MRASGKSGYCGGESGCADYVGRDSDAIDCKGQCGAEAAAKGGELRRFANSGFGFGVGSGGTPVIAAILVAKCRVSIRRNSLPSLKSKPTPRSKSSRL